MYASTCSSLSFLRIAGAARLSATFLITLLAACAGGPIEFEQRGYGAAAYTLNDYKPRVVAETEAAPAHKILSAHEGLYGLVLSPDGQIFGITDRHAQPGARPAAWHWPMSSPTAVHGITPDGQFLIVSYDEQGGEEHVISIQDLRRGMPKDLPNAPGESQYFQGMSRDGTRVLLASNRDALRSRVFHLYSYDIATGALAQLDQQSPSRSGRTVLDELDDGRLVIAAGTQDLRRGYGLSQRIDILDPKTGKTTPLPFKDCRAVLQGPRPDSYYVLHAKDRDLLGIDLWEDGKYTPVASDPKWDIDWMQFDGQRKRVLYVVNEGGRDRLAGFQLGSHAALKLPAQHGATRIDIRYWQGSQALMQLGGPQMNPRTQVMNLDTGAVVEWKPFKTPTTDASRFAPVTTEFVRARDGVDIPLLVRRPAQACSPAPCPVIVEFHGGPASQSRVDLDADAQYLVEAGFVVVQPNIRGSSGYGKKWEEADDGMLRETAVHDIEDIAQHIRNNWGAAGKAPRIGITGGSYGGYVTLLAMTRLAGTYDAGISYFPISSLISYLDHFKTTNSGEWGKRQADEAGLRKLSPMQWLSQMKGPVRMVAGANDPRTPVGEALQFMDAARKASKPVSLVVHQRRGHSLYYRDTRAEDLVDSLSFYNTHLKPATTDTASVAAAK